MAKKKAKVSKKKAPKVAKKAAKKATAKKKVAAKRPRPAAKKKAARKVARPAARKTVKKATKPTMKKRPVAKPKARATPKRPPAVSTPRPPAPAPLPAPLLAPAAPVIPPPPPPPEPKDRGPRFFEPEDLPTSGGPMVEGPILENDRRDRPFYDTEAGRTDLDEDVEGENGEHDAADDFDDEEDASDEDDDEGSPSRGRSPPPAAVSSGGASRADAMLKIGSAAPDFDLPDEQGRLHSLSAYHGRKVVLYFYPKDDTPGCTREACGFRDTLGEFDDRNAVVLGISPDAVASHATFVKKYGLTFPLLADANHTVAQRYGAWGEKAGPGGAKREGILRTTFIIDEAGRIAQVFRQVQPDGHEHQVLAWLDQNWLAGG